MCNMGLRAGDLRRRRNGGRRHVNAQCGSGVGGGFFGVGEIACCSVLTGEAADHCGAMRIACGPQAGLAEVQRPCRCNMGRCAGDLRRRRNGGRRHINAQPESGMGGGFVGVGEIAGCTVLTGNAADRSGGMRIAWRDVPAFAGV